MKLNLNDLLYFITIASKGRLNRAKVQLGGTQPTLSLEKLAPEERLGICLLKELPVSIIDGRLFQVSEAWCRSFSRMLAVLSQP